MLRRFREKKAFPGIKEKEFISYLAKVMNTSDEQIRETYVATEREDFATVAAKLTMDINETSDMSGTDTMRCTSCLLLLSLRSGFFQ